MTDVQFRKATKDDINAVETIQQHALDVLSNPEALDPVPSSELLHNIKDNLMALAIVDGEVAAFRTMHIPTEDYLGKYIGITDPKEAGLIYSDITIVDPDYRGLSLQRKLGDWLFTRIEPDYQVIMATVHPDNTPSLKDKFHLGMQIVAMDYLYGGKLRFIFMKDLTNTPSFNETISVDISDLTRIKVLLESGYRGIGLQEKTILFGK
ncbi:GNAT family N-acetyltransferase [Macrococcus animalis]|uniref:GNAT family N-acetyltransferase n=1 Tax=Macrococcus animalis TaxID=3395467 RepID=UPI0039BDFE42